MSNLLYLHTALVHFDGVGWLEPLATIVAATVSGVFSIFASRKVWIALNLLVEHLRNSQRISRTQNRKVAKLRQQDIWDEQKDK